MKHTKRQIQEAIAYWERQLRLGNYKRLDESTSSSNLERLAKAINSKISALHAEHCTPMACIDGLRGDKHARIDAVYVSVYATEARDGYELEDFIDEIMAIAKQCGISLKTGNIVAGGNAGYIVPDYTTLSYDDIEKDSLEESDSVEKIDDIVKYLASKKLKWVKVFKFQRLEAVQSKGGEEVETVGSDGNVETKRTTKKGDWIVNNVSNKDNRWIISDETFKKKYEKEADGIYKPKGGLMLAAKIADCTDKDVEFAPPNWGGDTITVKNDGWFMKDPSNEKDIYAISKKDFDSTYKIKK